MGEPNDPIDRLLLDTPAKGPLARKSSFVEKITEATVAEGGAAVGLRGLAGGDKPFAEMTPQERSAAQAPLSLAEAGRLAIPFVVGRFLPAGRTVGRVTKQVLGNIVGSAALEGGLAATKGEDVVPALTEGAVRGIPGGIAQGTVGALLGPTKATIKAEKSLSGFLRAFSPEVSQVLSRKTTTGPQHLFSDKTINAIQSAAGKTLDRMESTLTQRLSGQIFAFPFGTGPKSRLITPGGPAAKFLMKAPFEEIRGEIKRLRNIGEAAFADPSKQFKIKQRASQIEQSLLEQMESAGFKDIANIYREHIQQFAQDRAILRALKAVRHAQQIPGGLNRADSPIVAAAMDILQDTGLGPEARAAAMSALALSGHPFMALHFAGGGKRGMLDPLKIRTPLGGRFAGPLSATAGSLGSLLGGLSFPQNQGSP